MSHADRSAVIPAEAEFSDWRDPSARVGRLISPLYLAKLYAMSNEVVNIHAAKTQLSQLVKRAERGERITIARNGKPVAQIGPAPRARRTALPADDPLLNLETFAVAGRKPRGRKKLSNADIDRILYGKP